MRFLRDTWTKQWGVATNDMQVNVVESFTQKDAAMGW